MPEGSPPPISPSPVPLPPPRWLRTNSAAIPLPSPSLLLLLSSSSSSSPLLPSPLLSSPSPSPLLSSACILEPFGQICPVLLLGLGLGFVNIQPPLFCYGWFLPAGLICPSLAVPDLYSVCQGYSLEMQFTGSANYREGVVPNPFSIILRAAIHDFLNPHKPLWRMFRQP